MLRSKTLARHTVTNNENRFAISFTWTSSDLRSRHAWVISHGARLLDAVPMAHALGTLPWRHSDEEAAHLYQHHRPLNGTSAALLNHSFQVGCSLFEQRVVAYCKKKRDDVFLRIMHVCMCTRERAYVRAVGARPIARPPARTDVVAFTNHRSLPYTIPTALCSLQMSSQCIFSRIVQFNIPLSVVR